MQPGNAMNKPSMAVLKPDNPLSLVQAVRCILSQLPSRFSRRFVLLLALVTAVSGFETLALGVVALFATALTAPSVLTGSRHFHLAQNLIPSLTNMADRDLLLWLGLLMLALVLLKNAARATSMYLYTRFMGNLSAQLGESMLDGVLHMPYRWIVHQNSSNLFATLQFASSTGAFLANIFVVASESMLIAFMLALLVASSPNLMLLSLAVVVLPAALLVRWMRRHLDNVAERTRNLRRASMREAIVSLQGIKDVKLFGKEEPFGRRYSVNLHAQTRLLALQEVLANLPGLSLEVLGFGLLFMIMLIMYFALDLTSAQAAGVLATFAVFAWRGLPASIRVVTSVNKFRSYLPYVQDCFELLETVRSGSERPDGTPAARTRIRLDSDIHFDTVWFRYAEDGPYVVRGADFRVGKGESVGIIGESGAGKSTIVDLLTGMYQPEKGALRIDGHALDESETRAWIGSISCIPQAPYIFDGTLVENIAFGVQPENVDKDRVRAACGMAAMNDFIDTLAQGYDTPIGDRGIRLSGGQKQRVCIARALYTAPDVLLFDEATSSLDTKNERLIKETILSLKGHITMIIVAHRLSTVRECDRVVWVERGEVRMVGTPEEVLAYYAQSQNPELRKHNEETMPCADSSCKRRQDS